MSRLFWFVTGALSASTINLFISTSPDEAKTNLGTWAEVISTDVLVALYCVAFIAIVILFATAKPTRTK